MPRLDPRRPTLAQQRERLLADLKPLAQSFDTISAPSTPDLEARLVVARAAVLTEPSLAFGTAWVALERGFGPATVDAHSVAACWVAGLALARLGHLRDGQRLLCQSRHEAMSLEAELFEAESPGSLSLDAYLAALRGPARAFAASGRLERARRNTSRGLEQLEPASQPAAVLALALEESALDRALGLFRRAARSALLAQAVTLSGPLVVLQDRLLAWMALCLLDLGDLERLEVVQAAIVSRETADPGAAPFRLWAKGRAAALEASTELAKETLARAIAELGGQAQVVEHRLATLDLAALHLSLGEARRAIVLASTVLPEIGGWSQRAFGPAEDAAVRARIEGTPFYAQLWQRDLAPGAGPS